MARGIPASTCTSPRTKGWRRYKRFIASKASIPGECCTVDHIDHRFTIIPQFLAPRTLNTFNPRVLLCDCGSEKNAVHLRSSTMLIVATASEPSNAASKNGASLPNITLPTEMRTLLLESASYGRSTLRTSKCWRSYGMKDGM